MKAGCPVPLNWWDDEYVEKYKDSTGPHKLENMLEFGGSMTGLIMLRASAGPEGAALADQLESLSLEMEKESQEICSVLKQIGFKCFAHKQFGLINFDLPDPQYDHLDEILAIHGLAVHHRNEYRTIPMEYHDRSAEEQESVATAHAQVAVTKLKE